MSELMRHAAWILLITFALSLLYEPYRAMIKAGVSRMTRCAASAVRVSRSM
jgi:hypothetical protein